MQIQCRCLLVCSLLPRRLPPCSYCVQLNPQGMEINSVEALEMLAHLTYLFLLLPAIYPSVYLHI